MQDKGVHGYAKICAAGQALFRYLESHLGFTMSPSNSSSNALNAAQFTSPQFSFLNEIAGLVKRAGDLLAPEGYEDDTGFHFGPVGHYPVEGQNWLGEHI